jgi:hypothetical protein
MVTKRKIFRELLLRYWLFKTILLLVISNFLFCSFEKPSAPTFETKINVPLISETYAMQELVDDEAYLAVKNNGDLYFHVEHEIERFYVDENLKINPMTRSFSAAIGSFKIDSPGQKNAEMQLSEIAPDLARFNGQKIEVTPFELSPVQRNIEPFSDFQEVLIDSGFAILRVENNLEIFVGSPVNIMVSQAGSGKNIFSVIFEEEIPPHTSAEKRVDLSGKVLPAQMAIGISGKSAGSHGAQVNINAASSVNLSVNLTECKVSRAVAKISPQYVRRAEKIEMEDSLQIQSAKIETGAITLRVQGNLPLDALLTYTLADFLDASGKVLKDSFWVYSRTEFRKKIDLSGCWLRPEAFDTNERNFRFNWVFKTKDTGDQLVTLSKTDYLNVDIELSEIQFEQITGILSDLEVAIEPYQHEIDIPSDLDSLLLEDAQMELRIQSSINFPASSKLIIEGRNKTGQIVQLYVEESIDPAPNPGELTDTDIVLNKSNSLIVPFMNLLPNEIAIQGNVRLGAATWIGTINKSDYIEGSLAITTPLALALPRQRIELEPDSLDLDEDLREQIENRLLAGALTGTIENRIPIAASLTILFAQDSSKVFSQPEVTVGPIQILAAQINPTTGYATQTTSSPIAVGLDAEEMKIFEKSRVYVGLVFELPGTNGQVVKLHIDDFIKVNLALLLQVKIGSNDI